MAVRWRLCAPETGFGSCSRAALELLIGDEELAQRMAELPEGPAVPARGYARL